jgi:cell division protein FtsZ
MDYARRPQAQLPQAPRQQQLDLHGRAVPARSIEDDHLEIPAFLRRQSS